MRNIAILKSRSVAQHGHGSVDAIVKANNGNWEERVKSIFGPLPVGYFILTT